jgi:hypothetical protein
MPSASSRELGKRRRHIRPAALHSFITTIQQSALQPQTRGKVGSAPRTRQSNLEYSITVSFRASSGAAHSRCPCLVPARTPDPLQPSQSFLPVDFERSICPSPWLSWGCHAANTLRDSQVSSFGKRFAHPSLFEACTAPAIVLHTINLSQAKSLMAQVPCWLAAKWYGTLRKGWYLVTLRSQMQPEMHLVKYITITPMQQIPS